MRWLITHLEAVRAEGIRKEVPNAALLPDIAGMFKFEVSQTFDFTADGERLSECTHHHQPRLLALMYPNNNETMEESI